MWLYGYSVIMTGEHSRWVRRGAETVGQEPDADSVVEELAEHDPEAFPERLADRLAAQDGEPPVRVWQGGPMR